MPLYDKRSVWQPCIVSSCNVDVPDIVIVLWQECIGLNVGAPARLVELQAVADRIGSDFYVC